MTSGETGARYVTEHGNVFRAGVGGPTGPAGRQVGPSAAARGLGASSTAMPGRHVGDAVVTARQVERQPPPFDITQS